MRGTQQQQFLWTMPVGSVLSIYRKHSPRKKLCKQAFELFALKYQVNIRHYHADKGRFADNLFMKDVRDKNQTISFCGVNSHFQNGIAEKMIQDLQEKTRYTLKTDGKMLFMLVCDLMN